MAIPSFKRLMDHLWYQPQIEVLDGRVDDIESGAAGAVQSVNGVGPDGEGNVVLSASDVGAVGDGLSGCFVVDSSMTDQDIEALGLPDGTVVVEVG